LRCLAIDHQLIGFPTFRRQPLRRASRQRKPFLMMKMMPLMIRQSSISASVRQRKMGLDPAHLRLR